jgi:hypothetical protein
MTNQKALLLAVWPTAGVSEAIVPGLKAAYAGRRADDGPTSPTYRREWIEEFRRLMAEWKASRGHTASINQWVRLPAYRHIIDLGRARQSEVVPLILRELEQSPDHWIWALREITGANPVPPGSVANVAAMAQCWIDWGKGKGYRW